MSSARFTPLPRIRPALAALGLGLIGLTTAGPAMAGGAAASDARSDMGAASGLRVSQALDPYAASPNGNPAPGTPGAPSSNYGPYESRSSTQGAASASKIHDTQTGMPVTLEDSDDLSALSAKLGIPQGLDQRSAVGRMGLPWLRRPACTAVMRTEVIHGVLHAIRAQQVLAAGQGRSA